MSASTSNNNNPSISSAVTNNPDDLGFWDGRKLNIDYPWKEGCGRLPPPPNHRRSAEEVIAWRNLSKEQQQQHIDNYKKLNSAQKRLFESQVPGKKKKYYQARRTNTKKSAETNNNNDDNDVTNNNNADTGDNDVTNNTSVNSNSNVNNNNTDEDSDETSKHHGFTNPNRSGIFVESRKKRRVSGDRPTKISDQGSRAVQDARLNLMKAAATYIQTTTFHQHGKDESIHDQNMHMTLVLVNNINDSRVCGITSKHKIYRTKPHVTVMSSRREAVKDTCVVLKEYLKMKRSDDTFGKEWDILLSDESNNPDYLVNTLDERRNEHKLNRSHPKGGVRSSSETDKHIPKSYGTIISTTPLVPASPNVDEQE